MQHLFRKLARRDDLNPDELAALEASVSRVVEVPARTVIVRENVLLDTSNLLMAGIAAATRIFPTASARSSSCTCPATSSTCTASR